MDKRNNAMNLEEKLLYHQIHPVKLITDAGVTIPCLYLIWQHHLVWGIIVRLVPSLVVSLLIIQFADLEKIKQSSFGKYNARYMTRQMRAARFVGFLIMAIGSWYHIVWSIPLGYFVALLAWIRGIIVPR